MQTYPKPFRVPFPSRMRAKTPWLPCQPAAKPAGSFPHLTEVARAAATPPLITCLC